jgi:hypothetical protein
MQASDVIEKNWIPGHPDRTVPNRDLWTKHMWGNHMADAAAAEEWDDDGWGAHREHTTISIRDVLKTMALEPMWMWVDMYGTPITTAIPADIRARRLEKYLKRRDEYRAERGAPPVWVGTKVTFAARQYQLKEAPRGEMARRGKVIWDKGWHGGNKAKGDCTEEDAKCVMCGEVDSQRHWMIECEHAACISLKKAGRCRMEELVNEIGPGRDKEFRLGSIIVDWAWSRLDAVRLWTGLWSPQLMEDLETELQFGVLPKWEIDKLEAVAMTLGRILAKISLAQWDLKVHGTKDMIKKVDKFEVTMAAEVLLRRAREKKRRVEKKKEDKKEAIANMKGVGRAAAETKLAYHMAKWVDKVDGKLTQKEFSLKYADSINIASGGRGGVGGVTLTSSLVRGRII